MNWLSLILGLTPGIVKGIQTIVGDKALEWNKHDCFAVPNWAWHEHINRSKSEDAILFSVNDIPIVEAFNLYREEPENSLRTTQAPRVPAVKN